MDVLIINALLAALMNVLTTMARMTPAPGIPVAKKEAPAQGVVSAMMDMENEITKGSMAISFTEPVIKDLVKKMVGDEIKLVDETAKDLAGEIANMVVGGARALLSEKGIDFAMSTPQVLSGPRHEIKHKFGGVTVILPFTSDAGEFYLEINFIDNSMAKAS